MLRNFVVALLMVVMTFLAAPSSWATSPSVPSASFPVMAVRISGLVCDLCVHGIEQHLRALPHVVDVVASPRDGLVALEVNGPSPSEQVVRQILLDAGYTVHGVTLSDRVSFKMVRSAPQQAARLLWAGGAKEQAQVMSSKAGQQSFCAGRLPERSLFSSEDNAATNQSSDTPSSVWH